MLESFLNNPAQIKAFLIVIGGLLLFLLVWIYYVKIRIRPAKTIVLDHGLDSYASRRSFRNKYIAYMKSPEWENLKSQALEQADNKCERCGKPAQAVHHQTYPADLKDDCLENLQVLCNACHFRTHKDQLERKKRKPLYSDSIAAGNQHFRVELKEAVNKSKYIELSELRADEKGRSNDIKLFIFEESIPYLSQSINKAADVVQRQGRLVPPEEGPDL